MSVQPHPFLLDVARALLEKADRSRGEANTRLKLTASNAAAVFSASDAESMRLYELLLGELSQTGWVRLVLKKARDFQSFIDREPTLELLDFSALAQWAGYRSRLEAWDRRLVAHLRTDEMLSRFGDVGSALADYLARSPMPALEPLGLDVATQALERLRGVCQAGPEVPLRQLSAQIFQGRSKVLDNRGELLRILGARQSQFSEAPIQLLASVPLAVTEVVFVENLLTFELMASVRRSQWEGAMLLYAAGFRGGAKRLLEAGGAVVYVREDAVLSGAQAVVSFLSSPQALPVYFFGDLDYSGMEILRSLRQVFPRAKAWQPGYELLLELLRAGIGHMADWAGKEGQVDPLSCGCSWADSVLLPALRVSRRFVDQEAAVWPRLTG